MSSDNASNRRDRDGRGNSSVPMIVMALDLATVTGYAIGAYDQTPDYGSVDFRKLSVKNGLATAQTNVNRGMIGFVFSRWLLNKISDNYVDIIVYERPRIAPGLKSSSETSRLLTGLCFLTEVTAIEAGILDKDSVRSLAVQTVRKHFLGTGVPHAPKAAVIKACQIRGWKPQDDNAADALAIWDCFVRSEAMLQRLKKVVL